MEPTKKAFCSHDYGKKYVKLEQESDTSIQNRSRKIQKTGDAEFKVSKKGTRDKKDKSGGKVGYMTFLATEKKQILDSVKQQIAETEGLIYDELSDNTNEGIDGVDWIQHLEWLGYEMFNEFLKKAIPLCVRILQFNVPSKIEQRPYIDLNGKKLLYLRKKIKSWFDSEGIIETSKFFKLKYRLIYYLGGAAIIREDEVEEFIENLKEIIPSLPSRNFIKLREKVLPVIENIHKKSERVFSENMFSKHYWSDFTNKHLEVKRLWKKLPRTRASKENQTSSSTPSINEKQEFEENVKIEFSSFSSEMNLKAEEDY